MTAQHTQAFIQSNRF